MPNNDQIYLAICKTNNKKYIGFTSKPLHERRSIHLSEAKNGSNYIFHKAIRKYGVNNFEWKTIFAHENRSLCLNIMETFYIIKHKSHYTENGYNMTYGGECLGLINTGRKLSEEHKRKIGLASEGHRLSEEAKQKVRASRMGQRMTKETKKKLSKLHKGKKLSEEHKKKLIEANLGRKMTEENKQKLLAVHTGRKITEETREKMRLAHLGKNALSMTSVGSGSL